MTLTAIRSRKIDYAPATYGHSRLQFRGPARSLDRPYIAAIGGSETFGRFVPQPFADILETRLGIPVVNLGCMNAGLTAFQEDPAVQDIASGALLTVVQVLGAENMSNRYYSVHPRRNDRFLGASETMQAAFPEVDFTEVHFTHHLLASLRDAHPVAFEGLVTELRTAWRHRMQSFLRAIQSPTLLLWMSDRAPGDVADGVCDDAPMFIDQALLDAVAGDALGVVRTAARATGAAVLDGMIFDETEVEAAKVLPDADFHDRAAWALDDAIRPILLPSNENRRAG